MKIAPKRTVKPKAEKQQDVDPAFKAAWDQVTVAPEVSKTTVFNSGT